MADVVVPLVMDIISIICDVRIAATECRNASVVFDRSISVSKRRAIEAEIAQLRRLIASRLGAQGCDADVGLRLALLILGKDALIGALGQSLHRVLAENSGRRLADLEYPEFLPETGVPFIERVVVTAFSLAGCDFAAGDRVRIFLQSLAYAVEAKLRHAFFGAGVHACLGRPLSMEVWQAIRSILSRTPLRAHVLGYAPRISDYVFACPESLHVELRQ
jgi:hypothetical protein